MVIKEWIQLTLYEMADEIIYAIRKKGWDGVLTSKSCREIERIIHKYGEEILSVQNEDINRKSKK